MGVNVAIEQELKVPPQPCHPSQALLGTPMVGVSDPIVIWLYVLTYRPVVARFCVNRCSLMISPYCMHWIELYDGMTNPT